MKLFSGSACKQGTDPFTALRRDTRILLWLTAITLAVTFLLFVRVMTSPAPFP